MQNRLRCLVTLVLLLVADGGRQSHYEH